MDTNYFFLEPGRSSGLLMAVVDARPFAHSRIAAVAVTFYQCSSVCMYGCIE
jgi:hypothetical protein